VPELRGDRRRRHRRRRGAKNSCPIFFPLRKKAQEVVVI